MCIFQLTCKIRKCGKQRYSAVIKDRALSIVKKTHIYILDVTSNHSTAVSVFSSVFGLYRFLYLSVHLLIYSPSFEKPGIYWALKI